MIIGDLVKINDVANDPRGSGVVLKFDVYTSERITPAQRPEWPAQPPEQASFLCHPKEPIVEVLWGDGSLGWILKSRLTTDICDTYVQIHSP